MIKFWLALVVAVSGLTVVGSATGTSASAAPARATAQGCSFERLPERVDLSPAATGVPAYAAWSQTPVNRRLLASVHQALATVFGPEPAEDGLGRLDRGLIGLVLDHREQRFVVVLSRHLRLPSYQERIAGLLPPTAERGAAPVVVRHGCTSSSALAAGLRQARQGTRPAGRLAARVDPATSRVLVTLPRGVRAPGLAQLPGVAVEHGDVRTRKGNRYADRSPHFGAASISRAGGATCTAWATVVRPNGRRMGATAGHCGVNGSVWQSGGHHYGTARGKRNYPEQDSMRLRGQAGDGWRPRIHVKSGSRVVTGAANPAVGDFVCKSGQTTGVVCGIEVLDTSATACYDGGCNNGLIYAAKPCTGLLGLNCPTVGRGGDSGGPLYRSKRNREAGIRGMEVAGSAPNNLYAEKTRAVQRHLGVRVLRRR